MKPKNDWRSPPNAKKLRALLETCRPRIIVWPGDEPRLISWPQVEHADARMGAARSEEEARVVASDGDGFMIRVALGKLREVFGDSARAAIAWLRSGELDDEDLERAEHFHAEFEEPAIGPPTRRLHRWCDPERSFSDARFDFELCSGGGMVLRTEHNGCPTFRAADEDQIERVAELFGDGIVGAIRVDRSVMVAHRTDPNVSVDAVGDGVRWSSTDGESIVPLARGNWRDGRVPRRQIAEAIAQASKGGREATVALCEKEERRWLRVRGYGPTLVVALCHETTKETAKAA